MTEKKFYWIKLKTDCMADDTPLDALLSMPNGCEYVCLYIKLCLMTANKNGKLYSQFGEVLIPYDVDKIAKDTKHFSVDTVRVAMELYKRMGLIYVENDGILAITGADEMVGQETSYATKMRKYRDKKALEEKNNVGYNVADNVTYNVRQEIRDKSIEIRDKDIRDKEIEKEHLVCLNNKHTDKTEVIDNNGCICTDNRKRFVPPALEEVKNYIFEQGYHVDAERWYDHYTAVGWTIGKNKMKDWKASVRNWERDDKTKNKQENKNEWLEGWMNA